MTFLDYPPKIQIQLRIQRMADYAFENGISKIQLPDGDLKFTETVNIYGDYIELLGMV